MHLATAGLMALAAVASFMAIAALRNPPRALGWVFVLFLFLTLASCIAAAVAPS